VVGMNSLLINGPNVAVMRQAVTVALHQSDEPTDQISSDIKGTEFGSYRKP
jgi:hypothetical protein